MTISEYYRADGKFAQVRKTSDSTEFFIVYFDERGNVFNSEKFPGKSIHYVEDAAENWSLGIKEVDEVPHADKFISGVGTNSEALAGNHSARRGNVGVSRPDLDEIEAGDV